MFYDGDLQSGIGKAVQEAKLVACFVTGWFYLPSIRGTTPAMVSTDNVSSDDGEESQLWENEFLQGPNVS